MTVRFVAPRVPLVDPKTGLINTPWYLLFQQLFTMGGIDNDMAALVGPPAGGDVVLAQFATALSEAALTPPPVPQTLAQDDVSPPTQTIYVSLDDVLPQLGALRDEIAILRGQVDDLKKGPISL